MHDPPEGHSRRTIRLQADQPVALGLAESITTEIVRQVLKRRTSNPGKRSTVGIPEVNAEFAALMVVLDNLNTYRPAALHEIFASDEARQILKRLEFYYTPKHGTG